MRLFLLLNFIFISANLIGQSNVQYNEAPEVKALINKYETINSQKRSMEGYRIQLIQATNREQVYEEKAEFTRLYPNIVSNITYRQPYFKLRVGAFYNRLDVYKFFKEIKPDFSRSFIVRDLIIIDEIQILPPTTNN